MVYELRRGEISSNANRKNRCPLAHLLFSLKYFLVIKKTLLSLSYDKNKII